MLSYQHIIIHTNNTRPIFLINYTGTSNTHNSKEWIRCLGYNQIFMFSGTVQQIPQRFIFMTIPDFPSFLRPTLFCHFQREYSLLFGTLKDKILIKKP